jgi:hypothetical protein
VRWVGILVLAAAAARADDGPTEVHEHGFLDPSTEPLLELDPTWRPNATLDAPETTTRATYTLGANTVATFESSQWSLAATDPSLGLPENTTGDGWGAAVRLVRKVGPLRVGGYAAYQALDTWYLRGTYVDLGLSVGHTFRLSRWMHAWIALGVGRRTWQGQPPPGEANATNFMLTIGTTFR